MTVPITPLAQRATEVVWAEPFDAVELAAWREVEVRGRTRYEAAELDGRRCLKAHSQGGASILLTPLRIEPRRSPWLSWRWRVDQLVEGEALDRKDGSDAAARVYVYFESTGLPWQKRNLDYVWSASLPVGTLLDSAYAATSKILVAESGMAARGEWRTVERHLTEDFRRAFGTSAVPDVIAIGLMSDTDNTGGEALAYFDDLRISRTPLLSGARDALPPDDLAEPSR
jgi:hypothetical protein